MSVFFSKQVAHVHGPAQLDYKNLHGKKCSIYAVDSQSQHDSHGCGHPGSWGHGRGSCRGHGGHENTSTSHTINRIDILDPTHSLPLHSGMHWATDVLLLCSCMTHKLEIEVDAILRATVAAVDEETMNALLLPLTQWILQMRLF